VKLWAISRFTWSGRTYELNDEVICPDEIVAKRLVSEGHVTTTKPSEHKLKKEPGSINFNAESSEGDEGESATDNDAAPDDSAMTTENTLHDSPPIAKEKESHKARPHAPKSNASKKNKKR